MICYNRSKISRLGGARLDILLTSMHVKPNHLQPKLRSSKGKREQDDKEDKLEIDGQSVRMVQRSVQPHLGANVDILAY